MKHTIIRHLWAQPGKQWEGFRLVGYSLDNKAMDLRLTRVKPGPGREKEPTTALEIYRALADGHAKLKDCELGVGGMTIKTDTDKLVVLGPDFNCRILEEMLLLQNDGLHFDNASWFWYDRDSATHDLHDSYSFFVVCGDRIVRERVTFYDHSGSGFDPSVFEPDDSTEHGPPTWSSEPERAEARQRFWRRKFYKETSTGQLQALRDDRPEISAPSIRAAARPLLPPSGSRRAVMS